MVADGHQVDLEPWLPAECRIRAPHRTTTRSRPRQGQPGKERPCWDVRFSIDDQRYFRRFDRAGDADNYVAQLRRGEANGWLFDPAARRFVDPAAMRWRSGAPDEAAGEAAGPPPDTVFSWTELYWTRKWLTLEPHGRSELARYLNRARRVLVDVDPEGSTADDVDAYLGTASLTVKVDAECRSPA